MNWVLGVEISTVLGECLIAFIFYKKFLGNKHKNVFLNFISVVLYTSTIIFVGRLFSKGDITFLVGALLLLSLSFLFKGKIKIKLFATFLLIALIIACEAITMTLFVWLGRHPVDLLGQGFFVEAATITSKLMFLLLIKLVFVFRKKENFNISLLQWIALLTSLAVSSITIYTIYDLNVELNRPSGCPLSLISLMGLLLINIIAYYLFEIFLEKTEIEMREKLLQRQIEAQIAQCEILEFEQASQRSFLHDINHHITLLHELLEAGEIEKAKECLEKLSKVDALKERRVHTGNTVVDAIFNYKVTQAENIGISVNIDDLNIIPANIALDPIDMSILFANSLDNAIEACARIREGEKYIKVELNYLNGVLSFRLTNPTDGKLVKGKNYFKSTKETFGIHGLGIENMEKAVMKYKGAFLTEHKDGIFELKAVIGNV